MDAWVLDAMKVFTTSKVGIYQFKRRGVCFDIVRIRKRDGKLYAEVRPVTLEARNGHLRFLYYVRALDKVLRLHHVPLYIAQ